MSKVKNYKSKSKIGAPLAIISVMLILLTAFGFSLSQIFTKYVNADINGAVRGQAYDLWADIELGKRDFGEITPRKVVPDKVSSPGGVIVDRSVSPGRAYIWDSGNSRIIGINLADCYAVAENERCSAEIVIGQPSATDYGACNQDSSFQYYPNKAPSSASTLCGMPEWTHTTLEDKSFTSMYVDSNGDLYVADVLNHRVLKYISPFTTDQIADDVWGQADFIGNKCNLTKEFLDQSTPQPTADSICFMSIAGGGAGVSLDTEGNLWVADGGNNRVLRYPNQSGTIAKTPDIVLGQANFTTGGDYSGGSGLNRLSSPTSIRFDADNNLYVSDAGNSRVLKFTPPFSSSMNGSAVLDSSDLTEGLVSIELSPDLNAIFTYEPEGPGAAIRKWDLNGNYLNIHFSNWNPGGGSLGIDTLGDILVSAYVYQQDVARFSFDADSGTYIGTQSLFSPPGGYNLTSSNRFEQGGWGGVAAVANQLIVTDSRILYWNDPMNLTNGAEPSGYVGSSSITDLTGGYSIVKADSDAKVYISQGTSIKVYQAPLNNSSTPIATLTPPFNVAGGGTIGILDTVGGLAVTPHSEYLWVSNPGDNRVFRIRNPLTDPIVDVVLGQNNISGTSCNRGVVPPPNVDGSTSADRSMLCIPGALAIDKQNNLYVSDHFFESAGNWRMLMFAPDLFTASPPTPIFAPSATKEFPRLNTVTQFAAATFEPAFDSTNRMVVGYNPYLGPRFLEYYNNPTAYNPLNRSDSSYAVATGRLKDFIGWAFGITFDANNNLFVYDTNRGKVLIYKDPFGTAPSNGGGDNNGGNNGGGNNNGSGNNTGGGNNNLGNLYYSASTNNNSNKPGTTKPVSYVQVNDTTTVSYTNSNPNPVNVNQNSAQDSYELPTEAATPSLVQILIEIIKTTNQQIPLKTAGIGVLIFSVILFAYLAFSNANIFMLLPLMLDSILNRKKHFGGVIYDSLTGKPIAFAKVTILRKQSSADNSTVSIPVETSLTDLGGRYKLNADSSRNLIIEVKALGYKTFIKSLPANFDVAMDSTIESNLLKRFLSINKVTEFMLLRLFILAIAIWGYVATIYAQVSDASIVNLVLLGIYSLLFIIATYPSLYSLFLKRIYIADTNGFKLKSAIVRIFEEGKLVNVNLTNSSGVAKFPLDEGYYKIVTTKSGYAYHESEIEIGEERRIQNHIALSKNNQAEVLTSNLDLHDQVMKSNHDKFNLQ